jgi:hypothetical protein
VKNRASLLKTPTRLDRCSKMCLARIETDSIWTLNSGDADELAQTSRQIARAHLNIMKLSRELASVSRQIRGLMAGKGRCLPMPMLVTTGNPRTHGCKANGRRDRRRSAFAAVAGENGAVVVRVLEGTSGAWQQRSMVALRPGRRHRASPACSIQRYGIDPVEARHIVVSASLAARSVRQES